jgi:cell division protein FtsB
MKNKNNKLGLVILGLILVVLSSFILFNDYGLFKYLRLKSEINKLNSDIERAQTIIDSLDHEIQLLKEDELKIEEVARERYNMKRSNEKVLKIEEK